MVAEEDAFELNSCWSKLGLGLGKDMSSCSSTLIFITNPQSSSKKSNTKKDKHEPKIIMKN